MTDKARMLEAAIQTTLAQIRSPGNQQVVEDVLTKVVVDCLRTYQKKVNVGVQDSVTDLLDNFKQKVTTEIFDVAQSWVIATKREKILFPTGCRFLYNIGQSTIVVVEEQPMVRTLMFDKNLMGDQVQGNSSHQERAAIALPYVYFVLHFKQNRVPVGLYTGWRTSRMKTVKDQLFCPLLPNIHVGLSVCMGRDYTISGQTITEVTEEVIALFWSSRFNNDLSTHFWNKADADPRISTLRYWIEESVDDPFFILNANLTPAMTLDELMQSCIFAQDEVDPDSTQFRHHLSDLINECSEELFYKILKYFKSQKFEKHYPKEVTENLCASIKDVSSHLTAIVASMQAELQKVQQEVHITQKDRTHYGWEPRGIFWTNS